MYRHGGSISIRERIVYKRLLATKLNLRYIIGTKMLDVVAIVIFCNYWVKTMGATKGFCIVMATGSTNYEGILSLLFDLKDTSRSLFSIVTRYN